MKRTCISAALLLGCLGMGLVGRAQVPVPAMAPGAQLRSPADLDQMLGPIALYPDPLIAQILPASTLPAEIVQADRYVTGGGDPNLIDAQPWDPSVKALTRYPTVLRWMDDNLGWATALGQAFVIQQQDVMDSIQRLRAQAQALGNLQSTPQESVISDNGIIEIVPANPGMLYVPVYQPNVVYYQRGYGSPFITFGGGYAIGGWLDHDFDWHHHRIVRWGDDHPRPGDWWSGRPSEHSREEAAHARVWEPAHPARPPAQNWDRGYASRPAYSTPSVTHAEPRHEERHEAPAPVVRQPAPTIAPHPAPAPQPRPANGVFLGVQGAHQTQEYHNRGAESRQVITPHPSPPTAHPPTPTHPETPSRPPHEERH